MYRVKADYQEVDGTISESDFSSAKAALDYALETAIDTGIDNTISFIDTRSAIQTNHELASVSYMLFIDIDLTEWPDGMSDLIDAVKAVTGKNSGIVAKQHCSLTNCTRIWQKGYTEIELINRRESLEKDLLKLESELADLKAHGIEK
jgi:hypothetical protein